MIAMSSITKTSGNISGSASGTSSDPSLFSGNFLTADHWFSKTSTVNMNVDLDINLTTTNGLLHEIKLLMLSYNSITQIPKSPEKPKIPIEPRKIGYFERITPVEPLMPKVPQKAELPDLPLNQPWYVNYKEIVVDNTKFSILVTIAITCFNNFNLKPGVLFGLAWCGFSIVFGFPASFFKNKQRRKEYAETLKRNDTNYERDMKNHDKALQFYVKQFQNYKIQCEKADAQQKAEADSFSLYEKKCLEYENEYSQYEKKYSLFITQKNEVMKIREILWHRARLCMRCGTAYIAP
jgi:hypothetical protein